MIDEAHKRHVELLTRIVHEYILSGQPIGSLFLAEKYNLPMSSATIRNVMAILEEEGHLYQPHPSAGRIPTAEGFRVYIETMKPSKLSKKQHELLEQTWNDERHHDELRIKKLARGLSTLCGDVVFTALKGRAVAVTGISHLCEKQEFSDRTLAAKLSNVIDSLDETVGTLFDALSESPRVFVGSDGFSDVCGVIAAKFHAKSGSGIIGIIGPLRMNYSRNVALLKTTQSIIED
ncbi:hypothetical protein HY627_02530 [Candidatus Uhrbacteria bacterium]|nr:hypothetical protein [Candidatus Uhrbacteria bacterium]